MDTIIGISVLQPIWIPGIYRLWFRARKGSGETSQGNIFIRDKAATGLPDKIPGFSDGTNSIWKFTKHGNMLDCEPSVNWISWGFHNSGAWATEYVEMTRVEKLPAEFDAEDTPPSRWYAGHTVHYDLNLDGGRERIPQMREQGVLI